MSTSVASLSAAPYLERLFVASIFVVLLCATAHGATPVIVTGGSAFFLPVTVFPMEPALDGLDCAHGATPVTVNGGVLDGLSLVLFDGATPIGGFCPAAGGRPAGRRAGGGNIVAGAARCLAFGGRHLPIPACNEKSGAFDALGRVVGSAGKEEGFVGNDVEAVGVVDGVVAVDAGPPPKARSQARVNRSLSSSRNSCKTWYVIFCTVGFQGTSPRRTNAFRMTGTDSS